MPTWKKVVVSGSAISQLANDANYLAAGFSASIDSRIDTLEAGGDLSGSAHIRRAELSGSSAAALRTEYVASTSALSGSAHAQRVIEKTIAAGLVTSLSNGAVAANATSITNLSSSAATAGRTELTAVSASAHSQRGAISASLNSAIAGLGGDYATDVELGNVSSSFVTTQAALSSSAHSDRVAKVGVLSGSAHAQRVIEKNIAAGLVTSLSNGAVATNASSITSLSGSSASALRAEYVAGDSALSASAHIQRNVLSASLAVTIAANDGDYATVTNLNTVSASVKTYADNAVAASIDAAPEALNTLNELAAALGDDGNFSASLHTATSLRVKTTDFNTYSGSAAAALRTEYVAGDSALSGSAHAQRVIEKNIAAGLVTSLSSGAVATNATSITNLSSSAALAGRVELNAVSASAHTARVSGASSGSAHTQREALVSALSSSAAVANNSSAITVRNLTGQAVVASSFEGDGSNLSNITVDQNATVASVYTNVTSHAVTHNFGTKNVIVQIYDNNDQVIIPASITSTNTNTSTVTFDVASTGIVVVARGGHVVSGSIPYANLINTPSASFSSRINALSGSGHADRLAKVSVLSGSAHTDRIARVNVLSGSVHTDVISKISVISASLAATISANDGDFATVTALNSTSASVKTYADNAVAAAIDAAPAALDTLNELAAALGDDGNFSASLHTATSLRHKTADHLIYSASSAGALRTEYVAGDAALSSSLNTRIVSLEGAGTVASLSGSAHAQRVIEKNIAAGLVTSLSNGAVATNATSITNLSGSAHAQRVIEKGIAAGLVTSLSNGAVATNATSITNLSGSSAAALRAEYVASTSTLSGSAHIQRNVLSASLALTIAANDGDYATVSNLNTVSASVKDYADAAVAASIDAAPEALNTLNELAAALGDDGNFSASLHTATSLRVKTTTFNTYSGSSAGALRTEYVASTSALSGSAHAQRLIEKSIAAGLVTSLSNGAVATNASSITSLSGSSAAALRTEYKAGDTALSSSLNTRIVSLEGAGTVASLSGSAHAQRVIEKNIAAGLVTALSNGAVATNAASISTLSGSAHSDRASKIASAIDTISGSAHTDRIAKVNVLSASAHTARGLISSDFTIAGGTGSDTFTTGQTLTFAGTANEIETSVTNNQVAIGIVTNPTLSGNVTVTGNLIVTGDTIEQQVTNLNVEDKFILINSGSASGDSGIIFGGSGGTENTGTALFFDDSADVLALGSGVAFGATTAAVAAKVGTITESTAVPTAAPTYQGVGSMHVKTDSQDIYIYTAD